MFKEPAFLAQLRAQRSTQSLLFPLPSISTVPEAMAMVDRLHQKVVADEQRSHRDRADEGALRAAARAQWQSTGEASLLRSAFEPRVLCDAFRANATSSSLKRFLVVNKAGGENRGRQALAPFQTLRDFFLACLPPTDAESGRSTAIERAYLEQIDLQWFERDVYRNNALTFPPASAPEADRRKRIPMLCITGHIDHGKTTLLDYLQRSAIAATEAGMITQSIRAFTIPFFNRELHGDTAAPSSMMSSPCDADHLNYPTKLTVVDTPGHKIFAEMRLHGCHAVDYVLLLVALDEGIQPQTKEVIRTAMVQHKPVIVALNKVDLFSAHATQ